MLIEPAYLKFVLDLIEICDIIFVFMNWDNNILFSLLLLQFYIVIG